MAYEPLVDVDCAAREKSLTDEIGKETEERFFRAMRDTTAWTPSWYAGIRRASRYEDNSGIDFFAFVKTDTGTLEIAIQIKSSGKWVDEFFRRHPEFPGEVLVITRHMTDKEIRKTVFTRLQTYSPKRRPSWKSQLFRLLPSR